MFAEEIFLTITPTGVLTFNTVYGWSGHWSKNDINKWVRALEFLSVSSGAQHPWLLSMVNFLSLNTRVDTCSKLDLVSLAPGTGPGLTCDPSVTNFSPSLEFFILELKVNIFFPTLVRELLGCESIITSHPIPLCMENELWEYERVRAAGE